MSLVPLDVSILLDKSMTPPTVDILEVKLELEFSNISPSDDSTNSCVTLLQFLKNRCNSLIGKMKWIITCYVGNMHSTCVAHCEVLNCMPFSPYYQYFLQQASHAACSSVDCLPADKDEISVAMKTAVLKNKATGWWWAISLSRQKKPIGSLTRTKQKLSVSAMRNLKIMSYISNSITIH